MVTPGQNLPFPEIKTAANELTKAAAVTAKLTNP
jgi:hypothetical protein